MRAVIKVLVRFDTVEIQLEQFRYGVVSRQVVVVTAALAYDGYMNLNAKLTMLNG